MIDTEERCKLTELPASGCAHCRGHDATAVALDNLDLGDRFQATYEGHCGNCGGRIHEGDLIARLADGSGYACTDCLP